jgi:hypothetical protein
MFIVSFLEAVFRLDNETLQTFETSAIKPTYLLCPINFHFLFIRILTNGDFLPVSSS